MIQAHFSVQQSQVEQGNAKLSAAQQNQNIENINIG